MSLKKKYGFQFANNKKTKDETVEGNIDLPEEELQDDLQPGIKKLGSGAVSVFGSDMDMLTKKKLEARQHLNLATRKPNESIQSRYSSTNDIEKFKTTYPNHTLLQTCKPSTKQNKNFTHSF